MIPTINNADELDIVLERLGKQTYPHFEIVISDSKSKDHTKAVCEKHGATWIEDPSRNRADACNFALNQMDHDLVLFTDDDTVPPLDWVEKLIRWFDNPEVGAVGGPNFAPDDDPFGAKCADVAFCTKFMTAGTRYGAQPKGELVPITHNPGVNCAHRMANLREVGFFEEGCIGAEDVVLDAKIQRAGHKPIALVGGATGMVGDPSGKAKERSLLTREEVEFNMAGIQKQLEKLDAGAFGAWLADALEAIAGRAVAAVPCGDCAACCQSSQFVHVGRDTG